MYYPSKFETNFFDIGGNDAVINYQFKSDSLWQMNLGLSETMDAGIFPVRDAGLHPVHDAGIHSVRDAVTHPVRHGVPDCRYYKRTGLCRFGPTCRYNHPPGRKLAIANGRMMSEHPVRIGQPDCQYFLKTATCKFGASCKFNHPIDKAGIAGLVPLNVLGLPLRPNEPECKFYLKTGQCKFGNTCKFHHSQPPNMMVQLGGSPAYSPIQSLGQQSYVSGLTNLPLLGTSFVSNPLWQGPSSLASMILPQSVVSLPGWNNAQLSSVSSTDHQQTQGNIQMFGGSLQSEATNMGSQGPISQYYSGSLPVGHYPLQMESNFPERPGQPDCKFFMKTGDCMFGGLCKFHHPKERLTVPPNCALNAQGLPIRPGEPFCIFFTRYGRCKFGTSCKFDHPVGVFAQNNSASSSAEASGFRQLMRTFSGPGGLTLNSEGLLDAGSVNPLRMSLSEPRQMPSSDDNVETGN